MEDAHHHGHAHEHDHDHNLDHDVHAVQDVAGMTLKSTCWNQENTQQNVIFTTYNLGKIRLVKYTQFRLYGLQKYGLFGFIGVIWSLKNVSPYMKFRKYGHFSYIAHFCWSRRGPYIRNRVYEFCERRAARETHETPVIDRGVRVYKLDISHWGPVAGR